MKTKWFGHIFICLTIAMLSVSCSKKNSLLEAELTGGHQEDQIIYPHSKVWKNQHIDYMATKKVASSESSCLQCHKTNLGVPLKVSCAIQCHSTREENLPPRETPIPVPNKCSTCHASVTENKFAHYPTNVGLCTTCHTVSEKHLSGSGDGVQTKTSANDCYRCHTKKDNEPVVHGALKMSTDSCIMCHSPHGGNQRFFIKMESTQSLCTMCHGPDLDTKSKHGPVVDQKSCVNCHNPHSSKNEKLLKLPSKDLCLSCHDKTIKATLSDARTIPNIKEKVEQVSSKHTGAIMGDCTICHNPHGSQNNRILKENYSVSKYNEYPGKGANPYAACFSCHDSGMLNPDNMTTGFRDGKDPKKNYHWAHVVDANGAQDKTQGKSCSVCHDPHGSNQEFHINESWQMNGQPINIKYTRTEKGGECTYTCHDLKSYNRE